VREFLIRNGERVVFIGDEITEARREEDPNGLGYGYVAIIAALCVAAHPERRIEFINRGVGGDRVVDLKKRWDEDVIKLDPDWVSISIGLNDAHNRVSGRLREAVPLDLFTSTYRELIERTLDETNAGLILMEISVLGEDLGSEGNRVLSPYNEAIRRLAAEYDAILVPVNRAFRRAILSRPGFKWTVDGIHPNPFGHALIAMTWLKSLGFEI